MNRITTLNNPKHLVTLGRKEPKRISRDLYDQLVSGLSGRIKNYLRISTSSYFFVKSTLARPSFGDMDVVIEKNALSANWRETFCKSVTAERYYADIPNTDTTVFEYQGYQLNVHLYEGSLANASNFLRNEGCGELIDIMVKGVDMSFDINGLYMHTNIEERPLIKIAVDPSYCLRMTGVVSESLEYYGYTKHDIFKILTASAFFNRKVFLDLETDTERLAKSPILTEFIAYLKGNPTIRGEVSFDVTKPVSKHTMLLNFKNYAPKILEMYQELVRSNKLNILFDEKFNPEKVTALTGLEGERVIAFMTNFASKFKTLKEFQSFVITSLPETLNKALLDYKAETVKPEPEVVPEPAVEVPKLVGKAKAKAKAVAKKAKAEPKLSAEDAAKKSPKPKAATRKVKISTSSGESFEIPVTPAMEAAAWPLPPNDNSPSPWPFPSPRQG